MTPLKVLVVDDSTTMREAIKALLRTNCGCLVVGEGANGLEALELASGCVPDLVVMDVHMPVMGGLEALRLLKSKAPRTHVVIVSTMLEPETRDKALNLGAVACLKKGAELWDGLQAIVAGLSQALKSD